MVVNSHPRGFGVLGPNIFAYELKSSRKVYRRHSKTPALDLQLAKKSLKATKTS